jgi:hypothetical protein
MSAGWALPFSRPIKCANMRYYLRNRYSRRETGIRDLDAFSKDQG